MYKLIASPFLGNHFVLKPGVQNGVKVSAANYRELQNVGASGNECPKWLVDAAQTAWHMDLDGQALADAVLVREPAALGYGRASYEINLGCNY